MSEALEKLFHYCGYTSWNVPPEKNKEIFDALCEIRKELMGWKDIKSAPKDHTPFLINSKETLFPIIGWIDETTGERTWDTYDDPTLWHPIPLPPKEGKLSE